MSPGLACAEQLLDLGDPDTLDVSGEVTICAWIRPRAVDGYRNIVAHGFRWDPDQELVLRIQEGQYEFLAWSGALQDHVARASLPPVSLKKD